MNVIRETYHTVSLEIEHGTTRMVIFDPCLVSKQDWLKFVKNVESEKQAHIEHYIGEQAFFMEYDGDEFHITLDGPWAHCQICLDHSYKKSVLRNVKRFTKNINANIDWTGTSDEDDDEF